MTIKAFAQKYGIKYSMAVRAAAHVFPTHTMEREQDYSEVAMRKGLMQLLVKERNEARIKADEYDRKIREVFMKNEC